MKNILRSFLFLATLSVIAAQSASVSVPDSTTTTVTTEVPRQSCPEFCTLPAERGGRGKTPFRRWYFDMESGECKTFRYTGRNGNDNKFKKRHECEVLCKNICSIIDRGISSGESKEGEDITPEQCNLPLDRGDLCNESDADPKLFWYFDSSKQFCTPFAYFGCGGNDNRFDSKTDCESSCQTA